MKHFNLAAWSLEHKQLIYFLVLMLGILGCVSYYRLGRMEDPDYTIREMVIVTPWPGADAKRVEEQVTERIEKKLQKLDGLDHVYGIQSYSMPGLSLIYVDVDDRVPKKELPAKWTDARNLVKQAQADFPTGVEEPEIEDHFDDVYGMVYALSGDDYSYEELRREAENFRQEVLTVPAVKRVELLGVQTENVYVEEDAGRMARLDLSGEDIAAAVKARNTVASGGVLETKNSNLYIRSNGVFSDFRELAAVPIEKNGKVFHLGDIATIHRAYQNPAEPKFFYQGKPAIGIAVSMKTGENIIDLGEALDSKVQKMQKELPAGMELHQTVNQAKVVAEATQEFMQSLLEALVIIFLVSLLALGKRSGIIVIFCIPFVLAIVFSVMYYMHIDLQRISLGALILGLGLLVDDAMIVIEMMLLKQEQGYSRKEAAVAAYRETAMPMLTGTLITCAGFIPVGFATGSASEFCSSIFWVMLIALVSSWLVASSVTPVLGYHFMGEQRLAGNGEERKGLQKKIYAKYHALLKKTLANRKKVILAVVVLFLLSVAGIDAIREEYFPSSTRPEIIVRMEQPVGASQKNMEDVAAKFAAVLEKQDGIAYFTYHVGEGAPRFVLVFDPAQTRPNSAEFVIVAKNLDERKKLQKDLANILDESFLETKAHMMVLTTGSSPNYPVMLRVEGPDLNKVREIAEETAAKMRQNPAARNVTLTSGEQSLGIQLTVEPERSQRLGLTTQALGNSLQRALNGVSIGEYQEKDRKLPIILRLKEDKADIARNLDQVPVQLADGKNVPLQQVATVSLKNEDGLIYRKDLKPAIQVCAEIKGDATGDDVAREVYESLDDVRAKMPAGYAIQYDGALRDSDTNMELFLKPVPMMIMVIVVLLMLQLQDITKMLLTLLTAPLGIIGAVGGLLLTNRPIGFVVQMGILALFGIIIRNSVILMDQITKFQDQGEEIETAVIHAAENRLRPILLTAMAAILAMIPLARNLFWGPMAVAMGAGLFAATILTLFVLPALYVTFIRPRKDKIQEH